MGGLTVGVGMGDVKPRKSWNFLTSFSRPRKSWILNVGDGKSLKIMLIEKNHKESILLGNKRVRR